MVIQNSIFITIYIYIYIYHCLIKYIESKLIYKVCQSRLILHKRYKNILVIKYIESKLIYKVCQSRLILHKRYKNNVIC